MGPLSCWPLLRGRTRVLSLGVPAHSHSPKTRTHARQTGNSNCPKRFADNGLFLCSFFLCGPAMTWDHPLLPLSLTPPPPSHLLKEKVGLRRWMDDDRQSVEKHFTSQNGAHPRAGLKRRYSVSPPSVNTAPLQRRLSLNGEGRTDVNDVATCQLHNSAATRPELRSHFFFFFYNPVHAQL